MVRDLDKIFKSSKKIEIDNDSKIVIMSDCHRGIGNNYDNFSKNKYLYNKALDYYYKRGFVYIELGDGDEMWEVADYNDIVLANINIFKHIKKFHSDGRLIMIYGNHDMAKKFMNNVDNYLYNYYDNFLGEEKVLFNDLIFYESLVLNYNNYDIFLIHGHQVDFINNRFWRFTRFFIRNIWRFFEKIGVNDFTNVIKNNSVSNRIEKKLEKWSLKKNIMLIAGHTHRAIFPKMGCSLYFNDGSCVHPDGITCIEIEIGKISLVRWNYNIDKNNLISIERNVIEGNEEIINFFK